MTEYYEHLILKLLDGTISSGEREALNSWMDESEENRRIVADLAHVWRLGDDKGKVPDFQTSLEWVKLEAALHGGKETGVRRIDKEPVRWLRWAASITFVILCSAFLYLVFFRTNEIVSTTSNHTLRVTLPDGSEVWLNQESRLTYQDDFGSHDRVLYLEGEAFFDVKKAPDKPFVVRTTQSSVKVLGTSFNVRAYQKDARTEVHVVTGRVSFSPPQDKDGIILKPGETGTLNKNTGFIERDTARHLNALAWKEKRIVFKKATLEEVVNTMQSYFNIDIEVPDQRLLRCRFTSSFADPMLEEVWEALSLSLNLEIVHGGDGRYIVSGKGC